MELPVPIGPVNAGATLVSQDAGGGVRQFNWGRVPTIRPPVDMTWGDGARVYSRGIRIGTHGTWVKGGGFIRPTPFSGAWYQFATHPYDCLVAKPSIYGGFYMSRCAGPGMSYDAMNSEFKWPGSIYWSSPMDFPLWLPTYRNQSLTRAIADARQGDFNLLVAAAEGRESLRTGVALTVGTLKMLNGIRKGSMTKIVEGARLVAGVSPRRGQPLLKHAMDTSSSAWLNWSYGIAPLLGDIHSAFKAFSDGLSRPGAHFRAKGRATAEYSASDGWSKRNLQNACYRVSSNYSMRFRVKTVLDYRIDDPWLRLWSSLGLTNPALVAWELVPLSFVFDWFVPIGNFLESLTPPLGTSYLRGFTSVLANSDQTVDCVWSWADNPTIVVGQPCRCRATNVAVNREVHDLDPLGGSFYVKNPFSVPHLASAIALVNNSRKGRHLSRSVTNGA